MSTYAFQLQQAQYLRPPGPEGDTHLDGMRADPLGFVTAMARQYGDITSHHTDSDTIFMLNRPELARSVLRDNASRYSKVNTPDDRMLRPLLGNGLLTSSGADWSRQRQMCAPAFRPATITRFDDTIVQAAQRMTQRWLGNGTTPVDVDAELTSYTLTVLIRAVLGAHMDGIGTGFSRAVALVNRYIGHYVPSEDPDPADTRNRRMGFLQAKALLESVCGALVAARPTDGAGTLIERLVDMCSESELRDQVLTLVMAGHETTAKTLSWTLHLLDKHPHELELLQQEVDSALRGRLPTAQDVPGLPRCKQVIQEAMRLYPPVWLISRRAVAPDVLGGYSVAPGTLVCVSQWVLHRHPDYWQRPADFWPDRFADGAGHAELPSHLYLPFGGGDRICIGQHLAMLEATLALAVIVQQVRFTGVPGRAVEPEALVTLRPRDGLHMTVTAR